MTRKKTMHSTMVTLDQNTIDGYSKRREVVDAEGWTYVVKKPQKISSRTNKKLVESHQLNLGDFEINGVAYLRRTPEELEREFQFFQRQWEESSACHNLKKILSTWRNEARIPAIKNAVVLGLGSLSNARRDGRRTSATQLAAILTILNVLDYHAQVFVQDPQYIEVDHKFLTARGWKVLEDPRAFEFVNESSFVFAVHCYRGIYDTIATSGKKPAVLVGTNMEIFWRFDSCDERRDSNKMLDDMVNDSEQIDFPQIRHDFSDTKIYLRRKYHSTETKLIS